MLCSGDRVGRYTIVAPLGVEDGAPSYIAEDPKLSRAVRLTLLSARDAEDARAGSAVIHPNALAIYDVGQLSESAPASDERPFFVVTELLRGRQWRDLAGDASVPAGEKLAVLAAARSATRAYHARGLVQRGDFAENLIVRDDGVIKLRGFGIGDVSSSRRADRRALAALARTIDPPPSPPARRLVLPFALVLASVGAVLVAHAVHPRARETISTPVAQPPTSTCAHNADCNSGTRADAICSGHRCVSLASSDCTLYASRGAVARDDTVWVGTMFPMTGDNAGIGSHNARAIELAYDDFRATMPEGSARAFGLVECDDAEHGGEALRHLLDDVRVPAILGFSSGGELIALSSMLREHQTLAVATISTNPLVTRIPQGNPRLIWRTTYSATDAAGAIAAFVGDRFDRERRAAPLRVAVVARRASSTTTVPKAIFDALHFNGKSAVENGDRYREMLFDPASPTLADDYAKLRDALISFAPAVVIYSGESTIVDGLIAPVEKLWRRGATPPVWLNLSTMPPELFPFLDRDAARRKRFFGVTTTSSTPTNARFVLHYNEVYRDKITRTQSPNSSYDAFYLVAFASYAIGDRAVDGPSLSRAFERLMPPGRPVDVGVGGIYEAFTALRRGERIDVNGATGALDFDLERGESAFDQEILCVGVDDRGVANDAIESGLRYDTRAKKLVGSMRCP